MPKHIDIEKAKELFSYDKESGELTLKQPRGIGFRHKKGSFVGSVHKCGARNSKKQYFRTRFDGSFVYAHRIIWALVTGEQPLEIDHIDGNGLNNKWSNLRNIDHKTNGKNQKRHSTNTSGVTGVCYRKERGQWRARIIVDGQMINLGSFADKFEAICARKSAEVKHGFGVITNSEAA